MYMQHLFYVDTGTLYSKVYESAEETDSFSALWRYRTRLSLEHLSYSIQSKNHIILNKFLKQVLLCYVRMYYFFL